MASQQGAALESALLSSIIPGGGALMGLGGAGAAPVPGPYSSASGSPTTVNVAPLNLGQILLPMQDSSYNGGIGLVRPSASSQLPTPSSVQGGNGYVAPGKIGQALDNPMALLAIGVLAAGLLAIFFLKR